MSTNTPDQMRDTVTSTVHFVSEKTVGLVMLVVLAHVAGMLYAWMRRRALRG